MGDGNKLLLFDFFGAIFGSSFAPFFFFFAFGLARTSASGEAGLKCLEL